MADMHCRLERVSLDRFVSVVTLQSALDHHHYHSMVVIDER
jgi:hypothetical protein